MRVYIFQADLLCEPCGRAKRQLLDVAGLAPTDRDDEHTYDSDDYPKGPYPDGGGEADCPQHCDECGEFLANPLTSDGKAYVREAVAQGLRWNPSGIAVTTWKAFYRLGEEEES